MIKKALEKDVSDSEMLEKDQGIIKELDELKYLAALQKPSKRQRLR